MRDIDALLLLDIGHGAAEIACPDLLVLGLDASSTQPAASFHPDRSRPRGCKDLDVRIDAEDVLRRGRQRGQSTDWSRLTLDGWRPPLN